MDKNNKCQNVQVCQFGLPGFSTSGSSNGENMMNSYQFDMVVSGENQFTGTLIRQQKILFLTTTLSYSIASSQYQFIFNGLTDLIGATNIQIGLINPIAFTIVGYTLTGSTLSFSAIIAPSTSIPLYTIFQFLIHPVYKKLLL